MVTIWYESMDSQNESMFLRISYTIPASLVQTFDNLQALLYYSFPVILGNFEAIPIEAVRGQIFWGMLNSSKFDCQEEEESDF